VRLEGVQNIFGATHALADRDLAVGRNAVAGPSGEDGAGDPTLSEVMTGAPPSAGTVRVRDRWSDPAECSVQMAHEFAVETVYRDKSLGEKQPHRRNFFVGGQITNRLGFIEVEDEKRIAPGIPTEAIGFRGVEAGRGSAAGRLSGGERQGIAIGRATHFEADLIVFDEPTTALALEEVREVPDFVGPIEESLRTRVSIEQDPAHLHAAADRLVALDRGRIVGRLRPAEIGEAGPPNIRSRSGGARSRGSAGRRAVSPGSRGCRSPPCSCRCSACSRRPHRTSSRGPTSTRPSRRPCRLRSCSRSGSPRGSGRGRSTSPSRR